MKVRLKKARKTRNRRKIKRAKKTKNRKKIKKKTKRWLPKLLHIGEREKILRIQGKGREGLI